jgi:hypothetical protein
MTAGDGSMAVPRWTRIALALAWAVSSLAVGGLGWLLFAISDRRLAGGAGVVLLVLAACAAVLAGAVAAARRWGRVLAASLALSAALAVAGIAAAAMVGAAGDTFLSDLLLVGGIPLVCGLVSGLLGRRARAR